MTGERTRRASSASRAVAKKIARGLARLYNLIW